jgi:hypothetical protein
MSDRDQKDEALEALYREGAEEPPPELDRLILAAAERAGRRRAGGWRTSIGTGPLAGLATAAVLVLAVAVLLQSPPAPPVEQRVAAPAVSKSRDMGADATASNTEAAQGAGEQALRRSAPDSVADQALEEVMVGGSRREQTAEYEAPASLVAAPRGAPAQPPPPAVPVSTVSFRAPGCAEPYPLPDGAVVETADDGLAIRMDGATFTLRCADGVWVRERDQSNR